MLKNTAILFGIIFAIFFSSSAKLSAVDLKKPLNAESFAEWETYIKENAPSDSALKVVFHIARIHAQSGTWAKSREVFIYFYKYFKNKTDVFTREIRECEEQMTSSYPSQDLFDFYSSTIKSRAPDEVAYCLVKRMAETYSKQKKYDSAAVIYELYKPFFPNKTDEFSKVIALLIETEDSLAIEPLSDVNSGYDEWDPCPTPDGKKIFFSARRPDDSWGGTDVMCSDFLDGKFQKPYNIGSSVNSYRDETIDNISADGQVACLSGEFPGGEGLFDIVFAVKDSLGWSKLYRPTSGVNTPYQDESGCLSADGKALIFTSDRPGGVGEFHPYGKLYRGSINGNMDIYVSLRTDSGWSKPINLGKTINTPYAERSAYLHPDGKTLYFSSEGHYGLGGLDVFKSTRLSDTSWTDWSEPINLGKQINSAIDDWGYKISADGEKAYFAAQNRKGGKGGWDLFSIEMPKNAKPEKIVNIKGKILDNDNKPLGAVIKWENIETGEICGTLHSDPQTGEYFIALPFGKNYGYYAEKDGYYPSANSVDLRKAEDLGGIDKEIYLQNIYRMAIKGDKVAANNIFFDKAKSELKKESYPELNRLLSILIKNQSLTLEISGHTDTIGSAQSCYELSLRRAQAVADYLISKGANKKKIIVKGYGDTMPKASNDTEADRAKNRRVELRFLD